MGRPSKRVRWLMRVSKSILASMKKMGESSLFYCLRGVEIRVKAKRAIQKAPVNTLFTGAFVELGKGLEPSTC